MKKKILIIVLLCISIFFFIGNNSQRTKKAHFLSGTLYFPFINSLNKIEELFRIRRENTLLKLELASLRTSYNRLENIISKYENLPTGDIQNELEFKIADIIGYSGSFQKKNLIINKGRKNGIEPDFPVVSQNGIVGKVISASRNFSVILPLSNSAFKLGVKVKRNKLQGLLQADNFNQNFVSHIKIGSDIVLGDTISTSNLSSIFPANFQVGVVKRIEEAKDHIHLQAFIETFADIDSFDQVIVLFYKKGKDYEEEFGNSDR